MNLVAKAFIDNQVCSIVLLDIKKAFDLVDRDILLAKLYHYGIRGNILNWFRSYFSGRKQCTPPAWLRLSLASCKAAALGC